MSAGSKATGKKIEGAKSSEEGPKKKGSNKKDTQQNKKTVAKSTSRSFRVSN